MNVLYLCAMSAVLGLWGEDAMAARWQKAEIPVWDFTPEAWRPYVQATVDDFNANLPELAPRLRYVPMGEQPCDALPDGGKRGGISVCSKANGDDSSWSEISRSSGRITRVLINLNPSNLPYGKRQACHEFMHAITDAPDAYTSPHPDTSCVQGWTNSLGSWDIAYAARVYGNHSH